MSKNKLVLSEADKAIVAETITFTEDHLALLTDPEDGVSATESAAMTARCVILFNAMARLQSAAYAAGDTEGGIRYGALRGYVETVESRLVDLERHRAEEVEAERYWAAKRAAKQG